MSEQFTPGPWRYGPAVVTGKLGIIAADDTFVCGQLLNATGYEEMAEANARLIAAAPELYEDAEFLCARVRELEGDLPDDSDVTRRFYGHVLPALARMEAALAKAVPQ